MKKKETKGHKNNVSKKSLESFFVTYTTWPCFLASRAMRDWRSGK